MYTRKLLLLISMIGLLFFVLSCGGGGGSSSSSSGGTTVNATQRAVSSGDVDLILTSVASSGKKNRSRSNSKKGRRMKETLDPTMFEDKKCLIFIAKLSDISFTNVVAVIKTDDKGTYELKTEDIFNYLKNHIEDIEETASFADLDPLVDGNRDRILAAFKKLGVLRLRALYEDGGKIVSMDFFQNVTNVNPNILENADPRNRIAAHWVEKIFADLGIIPTEEQYEALSAEIKGIMDEFLKSFELPEGLTIDTFADAFKGENLLILSEEQKSLITAILASKVSTLTQEEKDQLILLAGVAHETVSDAISNDLSQNLTGMINSLGSQIQDIINEIIVDPTKNPAFAKLLTSGGAFLDTKSDTFKEDFGYDDKSKDSLIRFFISLGFPVVVTAGDETTEPMIAITLPMPGNISETNLPGTKYSGDRNVRVFKVSDIATMVTDVNGLFTSQEEIDALSILPVSSLSETDFKRLERLRVLHRFISHLKRSPPLVSTKLLDKLLEYSGSVKIKDVASTMTSYFVWRQESISLVDDGKGNMIPVFTGGVIPPSTGETVADSEIIRKLGVQLGADPITAVESLTSSDSFLFQFIGKAIQEAVNRANLEKKIFTFPKTIEESRALIRNSNVYKGVRDSIGRGLIVAFPALTSENTLYGKLLDGETSLNAKSAIFFVTYLMQSKFRIDRTLSYLNENTLRPRLDNNKFLASKDSDNFSLVKFVTTLLSISEFSDSDSFLSAENLVKGLGSEGGLDESLYHLPEFRENVIPNQVSKKANIVASANFEFYDGRTVADISALISGSVVPVKFGHNGPEIADGASINGVIEAVAGNDKRWKITFSNVASNAQYLVALKVVGYTNDVPYLFFFADGFADPLNITKDFPFIIPPDEKVFDVPCVGMLANQQIISGGVAGELMGIDFSKFEEGLPFLFPTSKDGSSGFLDLRFVLSSSGKFSLNTTFTNLNTGATDSKALIAPLYVDWSGTTPKLGIKAATGFERLVDPSKALGLNFLSLISSLVAGDLTSEVILTDKGSTNIDSFFASGEPLYLLKDRKEIYWVIGVKDIDNTFDPGFIDIGFVRIGPDGKALVPDIRTQKFNVNGGSPINFVGLHYGDYANFPVNTTGGFDVGLWEWSAPEEVPFGYNSSVAALAQIRYAGEDFENRVGLGTEAEVLALNNYIKLGDFTNVPSRLDYYGPVGGGLAVLQFNNTTFTWPSATGLTFSSSVSSLKTGDLVLMRFKDSGDADLIALIDKKTGNPSIDNFKIDMVVANYSDAAVQIAGVLVDADKDGFIAKFDPNDNDPNIKPNLLEPKSTTQEGSTIAGASQVTGIFASENGTKFIFVEMFENMDEVYQISVAISVKYADGTTATFPTVPETNLFEITPADFTNTIGGANPTAVLKTGTAITLSNVSFNSLNFDLTTVPTMFNAGGTFAPDSRVIFDFEFKFRPRDPATGLPISDATKFGSYPIRPPIKGKSELLIPALANQVGDFDKNSVLIQLGSDTPKTMADNLWLEPQKEIKITWGAVTNADFYEISIDFENVSSEGFFLPYYRQNFKATKNDRFVLIPAFLLPSGRSGGDFQIIARRLNALGQPTFDGSVANYKGISTTGESGANGLPPGGVNDIKLVSGDTLYFHADKKNVDTIATGGMPIFTITPNGTSAQIVLSAGISATGTLGIVAITKKSKNMQKNMKDSFAVGSTITVTPGTFLTFLGVKLGDGSMQAIDVNFNGFRVGEVIIQAFLPPPFIDISTGGSFDINNDLAVDVIYDGASTLTFTAGIKVAKFDPTIGPVLISTAGVATNYSLPVGATLQNFELEFSNGKRYWLFIDLVAKTMQWGEIFGGTAIK